jgi:AraC family ethanolamine operon transcriptional activator
VPDLPGNNHLLVDMSFDDLDTLSETIRGWGLELLQLGRGAFDGHLRQWHAGDVLVTRGAFRRKLMQRGVSPPETLTIGVPAGRDLDMRWRGERVTSNHILVVPADGELDAVSSETFDVYSVSIPEPEWSNIDTETGGLMKTLVDRQGEACRCSPESMKTLRRRLRRSEMAALGRGAQAPLTIPVLAGEAIRSSRSPRRDVRRSSDRRRALHAAVRFIDDQLGRSIRIGDICRATGVSERTLQYAFQAEYGLTPIQFVRVKRLGRARRELLKSKPSVGAVARIAGASGYGHGGQFAADYRDLFGERPSETLRREFRPHHLGAVRGVPSR